MKKIPPLYIRVGTSAEPVVLYLSAQRQIILCCLLNASSFPEESTSIHRPDVSAIFVKAPPLPLFNFLTSNIRPFHVRISVFLSEKKSSLRGVGRVRYRWWVLDGWSAPHRGLIPGRYNTIYYEWSYINANFTWLCSVVAGGWEKQFYPEMFSWHYLYLSPASCVECQHFLARRRRVSSSLLEFFTKILEYHRKLIFIPT